LNTETIGAQALTKWERTIYGFLAEKERRSGLLCT